MRVSRPWVRASDLGKGRIQIGGNALAICDRDQVDVLAQPSVRKVGAGKSGAADEVDTIAEIAAEKAEQVGDQVISFDLLGCA